MHEVAGCRAGMDLAEITRSFPAFVAGVGYSATPQEFLELPTGTSPGAANKKHLLVLAPRYTVNDIEAGFGVY